jgi:hypothetical protein
LGEARVADKSQRDHQPETVKVVVASTVMFL